MTSAQAGIIISIVVYLMGMLLIGFICSKQTSDVSDFYLGGRKLGPLVTAMSAEASDMSSYLLMGVPGLAYFSGIADAGWTAAGLMVGTYLNWLFTAKRLRLYSERVGAITVPDYIRRRFHDDKNITLLIGAAAIIIFFVPYTASGFAACGKLFASLFGVNYELAMIVSAIVIVGYTTTGGFLAASQTDFIQSIVMTLALIIVIFFGVSQAGGIETINANITKLPGYLSLNNTFSNVTGEAVPYSIFHKVTMFCWGLGYFGMPHILLRFMAIEKPKKLKLSRRVASVWVVLSLTMAVCLGLIARGMTMNGTLENLIDPDNLTSSALAETLLVRIADLISRYGFLFAIVAGIIIAGILASTMSTADSQLIAASSAVSEDLMQDIFHIQLDERKQMIAARATLVVVALFAIIIAWNPNSSIFGIVSFAWAGFGAVFGPTILLSLYWKRSNRAGAIAGMISGLLMVFIWKYAVRPLGGVFDLYELAPAFLVSLLAIVIVSLRTKAPSKKILKEFEDVANG